jgi:hypothetical protein
MVTLSLYSVCTLFVLCLYSVLLMHKDPPIFASSVHPYRQQAYHNSIRAFKIIYSDPGLRELVEGRPGRGAWDRERACLIW